MRFAACSIQLILMTFWQEAIIFAAAFMAGMVNSVAGGGTLISFPTLVWLGRNPIIANTTNAVALWPGSLAGMIGFRRELAGSRRWILLLSAPSLVGGVLGAYLLLHTSSRTFSIIVPYLILLATLLLAAQELIMRRLRPVNGGHKSHAWWASAVTFQLLVGIYGGYFGAGIGILMLAALGLLGLTDIHQMNGLKNFFALYINGIAAVYFVWSGTVIWVDALLMAVGAIVGGYSGAGLARKLGRRFVRYAVIGIGLTMTVALLFRR